MVGGDGALTWKTRRRREIKIGGGGRFLLLSPSMNPSATKIRIWQSGIRLSGNRQCGIRQSGNRQSGIRRSGIRRIGIRRSGGGGGTNEPIRHYSRYSAKWDSAMWDSVKWDSAKWDSAKWDYAMWDSAKWDSVKWEDTNKTCRHYA